MWYLIGLVALSAASDDAQQMELLRTFREEFVAITPGEGKFPVTFKQGSDDSSFTSPVREVRMTHPFAIAKYEVPQNLWEAVTGKNPSRWKGERNSAEMLSHREAVAFCRHATQLMREQKLIKPTEEIRLPSESEWEYCCRVGTTTKYSFGDDEKELGDYCWFHGNAAGNDPAVGAKKPNAWGLYDMHGYLREWCSDMLQPNYENAPVDGGPVLRGKSTSRILRGGSWKDNAECCTSFYRAIDDPDSRDDAIGLRCVLAEVPTEPTPFQPASQERFVTPDAKLELLWGEGEFTEGPALAPDGSILFSDIGNTIWRFDPATKKTEKLRDPSGRANGLMFTPAGQLLACEGANTGGGRRLSITTGIQGGKDGTVKTLSPGFDGKKFNSPNDLAIAPNGTIFMSDPRYVGDDPRELDFEGVFAIKPDGTTGIAVQDVEKPNGILVSADGKRLIVADNNPIGARQLLSFYLQADGQFAAKSVLWDFRAGRGIDGMTLDDKKAIYATAGTGKHAGIYVFNSSGDPQAFIPTPGDPTNCCFGGGKDNSTLYITAAIDRAGSKYGLFRISTIRNGYHLVKLQPGVAE